MSSGSQLPGATVDVVEAQSDYSRSTFPSNPNTPRGIINTPVLSALETPAFLKH